MIQCLYATDHLGSPMNFMSLFKTSSAYVGKFIFNKVEQVQLHLRSLHPLSHLFLRGGKHFLQ